VLEDLSSADCRVLLVLLVSPTRASPFSNRLYRPETWWTHVRGHG